jgi:hypothetical protein
MYLRAQMYGQKYDQDCFFIELRIFKQSINEFKQTNKKQVMYDENYILFTSFCKKKI